MKPKESRSHQWNMWWMVFSSSQSKPGSIIDSHWRIGGSWMMDGFDFNTMLVTHPVCKGEFFGALPRSKLVNSPSIKPVDSEMGINSHIYFIVKTDG